MKKTLTLLALLAAACTAQKPQEDLTQWVNPFIGTEVDGHVHPGAQLPFGMVQLDPDTGTHTWEHCSGYANPDSSIIGFSHTHLSGTGCPDMGDIMVMPVVGNVGWDRGDEKDTSTGYRSKFSHDREWASPNYYKVELDDYGITAELTATQRVGVHKYTYPASSEAGLIVDLGHGIGDTTTTSSIKVISGNAIGGMRRSRGFAKDHTYYFYMEFSKPVFKFSTWTDGVVAEGMEASGKVVKAFAQFQTAEAESVTLKMALSTSSIEGAMRNFRAEAQGKSFEQIHTEGVELWNQYLSKVDVETVLPEERTAFYTSLYHTLVMPNKFTDVDYTYGLPDGSVHNDSCDYYTNFSLWDTYRATHPFYELMYPSEDEEFVNSMLELYKERGILCTNEYAQNETWCMIGNHAVSVVADAYLKGRLPEKRDLMAESIYASLTREHPKSAWAIYDQYGYYPYDKIQFESVSRTLEHCYDDYCAALVAKARGDKEQEAFFGARSDNFKNVFDPETRLMRPKDSKGQWMDPFDPFLFCHASTSGGDYTESNAWVYTWHVQHAIPALAELMGSKQMFESQLDSLFFIDTRSFAGGFTGDLAGLIGQYAHGNEPSHHIAYLYDYTDNAHKAQELVARIFDEFYLPARDGLIGNDDCGQMSAWYLFSALGFYPVDPVSGEYVIGAPQVKSLTLHLPSGKDFVMKAPNRTKENKYVVSAKLNGRPLKSFTIRYEDIKDGGCLEFVMASTPQKNFWE